MRRTILRAPLAALSTDHSLISTSIFLRDGLDRPTDHVAMLIARDLPDDVSDRHPVPFWPSPASYPSNIEKSDDEERCGGRNYVPSTPPYTTLASSPWSTP